MKAARRRTAGKFNRDVLKALAKRPSDRFFLYVHYIDVHDWSLFRRSYRESVEMFDQQLDELLDQLEADGLLENATVFLTSDHGEMLVDQHDGVKVVRHFGNPAYEPVLTVPLIVTPQTKADGGTLIRSQDLHGMIGQIAGLGGNPAPDLASDALFVSEMSYQNYRSGRWKSIWARSGTWRVLYDLVADPGEHIDLAGERADILAKHRERIDELSIALSSDGSQAESLGDENLARLRALGYIDSTKDEFWNGKAALESLGSPENGDGL